MRSAKLFLILFFCCGTFFVFPQQNISDLRILLQNQFLPAEQAVFSLTEEAEWTFSEKEKNDWKKASVPGCVHTDLVNAEELYYGDNEKKYQWIEEKEWEYKTSFRLSAEMRQQQYRSFELVFEQLEPGAAVYLNGKMVLYSINAFVPNKADITASLKKDSSANELVVKFPSIAAASKARMNGNPIHLPGDERVYARKAQFEFGWDFGPRFVTTGIRKPVYLVARTAKAVSIEHISIHEKKYDTLKADLEALVTLQAESAGEVYLCRTDVMPAQSIKVQLQKGKNTIRFPFSIDQPRLWWPRGYGESVFYPLRFTVQDKTPKNKKSRILSEKNLVHAFCRIELVQEKDQYGTSFYFKINGKPVFAKGVNMIPYDVFAENWNDTQLNQVYALNANMVRIWGGGYYPSDEFYLYCLANGILVWQDFMFACAMYPGDSEFLGNVKKEVQYQVGRLQQYRNIALWCGNNENSEGWFNWGWQKQYQYSATDSAKVWKQYQELFLQLIPATVAELDSTRAYWPSSPLRGWGRKESLTEGDCHYWGVWWGKQPIDTFNYKIPRFMSEYGMQSMPPAHYLLKYAPLNGSNMDRTVLANHQKHPSGFGNLDFYLDKYYRVPGNIFHYVYASQLLQARTMRTAIEAHRRHSEKCMGTLVWQMNDCWPGVTWSLVDHRLNKKIAYEQVKNAFETFLVSVEEEEKEFGIYVVSDSTIAWNDTLSLILYDRQGKECKRWVKPIKIEPGCSRKYLSIAKTEISPYFFNSVYAVSRLHRLNKETHHDFVNPNQKLLDDPGLKAEIVPIDNPCSENCLYEFRLTASTYCPGLALFPKEEGRDLIYRPFIAPGYPLTIRFRQQDYAYYRDLTQQPAEKFMYLYKLMKGK